MARLEKMSMEAGGISRRAVTRRSMVRLLDGEAVVVGSRGDQDSRRIPAPQMGSMRMMDLSSSTWCTVDSRHGRGTPVLVRSPGVTIAARSKKLKKEGTHGGVLAYTSSQHKIKLICY